MGDTVAVITNLLCLRSHYRHAKQDRTGLIAAQQRHHTCMRDLCLHFQAKAAQMVGNQFCRANLPITQLRVLMDIAPPGNDFALDFGGTLVDLGCEATLAAFVGGVGICVGCCLQT